MFDTFLLRPSLHCNTPLQFTTLHYTLLHFTLHPTTLHYTYRHFTSSHLHFTQLHFTTLIDTSLPLIYTSPNYTSLHLSTLHFLTFTLHYPLIQLHAFTFYIVLFHLTSLNQTQYISQLQTYFQNNEPLHCPKELLTISLHFTFYTSLHVLWPILYGQVFKTVFRSFNNPFYIRPDARRSITFTSFFLR